MFSVVFLQTMAHFDILGGLNNLISLVKMAKMSVLLIPRKDPSKKGGKKAKRETVLNTKNPTVTVVSQFLISIIYLKKWFVRMPEKRQQNKKMAFVA